MEPSDCDKMTPFDKLITSRELQMLKLLIPYTPPGSQRMLAFYVKFLELEHTVEFFRHLNSDIHSQAFDKSISSPTDLFDELRPYLPKEMQNSIESVLSIMNVMEMVSTMKNMTANEDDASAPNINPMDMMKEMLTPEQQNMFEMYSEMFNETVPSDMKGEENDG